MSASRGPSFTTALLDDLAVIYAVCGVAKMPFDIAPYGYSRADVEAHLKQHGARLTAQIVARRQDKPVVSDSKGNRLVMRWHGIRGGWRCVVGIHRLRGHIGCGDGVHVAPYDPYASRPGKGAWRTCDWCGATWVAAYDGIAPFWQRSTRRPTTSPSTTDRLPAALATEQKKEADPSAS